MTESSLSTTATTRTTPATENSSTWRGRAGPSKNVSDPPRMRLDSTTTRSAPGTPGTDISPSPYSLTPLPKSVDSSTSFTTANTPSPAAWNGQLGAAGTKPRPAGPTSDATFIYRHS